ncbi:hypothetical protein K2X33_09425 [bacterium]|nr:hypothetical protein [bacterium]
MKHLFSFCALFVSLSAAAGYPDISDEEHAQCRRIFGESAVSGRAVIAMSQAKMSAQSCSVQFASSVRAAGWVFGRFLKGSGPEVWKARAVFLPSFLSVERSYQGFSARSVLDASSLPNLFISGGWNLRKAPVLRHPNLDQVQAINPSAFIADAQVLFVKDPEDRERTFTKMDLNMTPEALQSVSIDPALWTRGAGHLVLIPSSRERANQGIPAELLPE